MLWTAFLPVLGLSILYCLQAKKESSLLLASVGDDSDMKIVPPSGITPSLEDAGEKAAQEEKDGLRGKEDPELFRAFRG